jgi:two-component system phosphate regulon sensor histidine kinase PhoR
MKSRRLLWQIYPSYLLIILVSLVLVSWFALRRSGELHRRQLERDLHSQAVLFEQALRSPDGGVMPQEGIAGLCNTLGRRLPLRLTVLLADGRVIGDSHEDPQVMENHLRRPEVEAAMAGKSRAVARYSSTVRQRMLYVVLPVKKDGRDVMFVRVAVPVTDIDEAMRDIFRQVAGGAVFVILLAAVTGLYVSRRLTRPLEAMREGAARFSAGELAYRLPLSGSEEMAALSGEMNRMAELLDRRLNQLFHERNTREAVFDSMTEGILAVDVDRNVIHINRAGTTLLQLEGREVMGKPVESLVRNASLQRLLRNAIAGDGPVEGEVETTDGRDLLLKVRGTALRSRDNLRIGALIIMQDLTHMRRLEQMRQDFVANVSHELKTPITSIKGFAETLLDGADDDPAMRQRFLGIIARQAQHLDAIVADLLLLSSVEHGEKSQTIALERLPLRPVLDAAVEVCRLQAEKKRIEVKLDCDPLLEANLSPHLFEQALVNLLDNAIKYSGEDSAVTVGAAARDHETVVFVRDAGSGIEQRHLDRIFERFYRVDKGRSRQMGGTGLGLSIVKHIATALGGRVTAESHLGEGSIFRIHLPDGRNTPAAMPSAGG